MSTAATAVQELYRHYLRRHPDEVAEWLSELSSRRALAVLGKMPDPLLLHVWSKLPFHVAHALFAKLPASRATLLLARGDPGQAAQTLRALDVEQRETYLCDIQAPLAKDLRRLLDYPPDSAGALMHPVVATFRAQQSAQEVLKYLRRFTSAENTAPQHTTNKKKTTKTTTPTKTKTKTTHKPTTKHHTTKKNDRPRPWPPSSRRAKRSPRSSRGRRSPSCRWWIRTSAASTWCVTEDSSAPCRTKPVPIFKRWWA